MQIIHNFDTGGCWCICRSWYGSNHFLVLLIELVEWFPNECTNWSCRCAWRRLEFDWDDRTWTGCVDGSNDGAGVSDSVANFIVHNVHRFNLPMGGQEASNKCSDWSAVVVSDGNCNNHRQQTNKAWLSNDQKLELPEGRRDLACLKLVGVNQIPVYGWRFPRCPNVIQQIIAWTKHMRACCKFLKQSAAWLIRVARDGNPEW